MKMNEFSSEAQIPSKKSSLSASEVLVKRWMMNKKTEYFK